MQVWDCTDLGGLWLGYQPNYFQEVSEIETKNPAKKLGLKILVLWARLELAHPLDTTPSR